MLNKGTFSRVQRKKTQLTTFLSFQKLHICHISQSEHHDLRGVVLSLSLPSAIFLQIIRDELIATTSKENSLLQQIHISLCSLLLKLEDMKITVYILKKLLSNQEMFLFLLYLCCAYQTLGGIL